MRVENNGIEIAGTGAPVQISADPLWAWDLVITTTAAATITGANDVVMANLVAGVPYQIPGTGHRKQGDEAQVDLSQYSITIAGGQTAYVSYSVKPTTEISSGITPLAPTEIADVRVSVEPEGLAGFADDGPIDVWVNETGLGNDFTQATEANKPLCKTNILNGFSIARFDGVSDRISTQYGPKDDLADGFTFAAVFRTTTTGTRQIILWTGDSNSPGFPPSGFPTSTFSITDDGVADVVGNVMFSPTTDDPKSYSPLTDTASFHIGICTFSGFGTNPGDKTVQMFLDGVFADPHTESFSEGYTQYVALTRMATPGNLAANFFSGDIAAAAIFARALSESEILGLYQFWVNKFNL